MRRNHKIIAFFDPVTKTTKVSRSVIFNEENANLSISPSPSSFLFTIDKNYMNDKKKDCMDKVPYNSCNNPPVQ